MRRVYDKSSDPVETPPEKKESKVITVDNTPAILKQVMEQNALVSRESISTLRSIVESLPDLIPAQTLEQAKAPVEGWDIEVTKRDSKGDIKSLRLTPMYKKYN